MLERGDGEDLSRLREETRTAARSEIVKELAGRGIVVEFPSGGRQGTPDAAEVDVSEMPEMVALSEKVAALEAAAHRREVESRLDAALSGGFIYPAQKQGFLDGALMLSHAEGLKFLDQVIPAEPVVDLSERGTNLPTATPDAGVDVNAEKERYLKQLDAGKAGE